MPSTTHDAEYEALIAERYGRPLSAIVEELNPARPLTDLLKERHRRLPPPPASHPGMPAARDPRWAEHQAVLEAAIRPPRAKQ
ncbi:hypothetical protein ACX9I7_00695 [Streptomyces sp. L500]